MVNVQRSPRPSISADVRKLYYPDLPPLRPPAMPAAPTQPAITSTGSYIPTETPAPIVPSGNASSRLPDLEKELTCSICTEILYQPLTLLDCLHTFCGGCLKEWFKWQGISAAQKHSRDWGFTSHSQTSNPYTCPSCRAGVRETRPNATVTSLLDMYLSANPTKGRTEAEKKEADQQYTRGENVLTDVQNLLEAGGGDGTRSGGRDANAASARAHEDDRRTGLRNRGFRQRRGAEESGGEDNRQRRQGVTQRQPQGSGVTSEQEHDRHRRRRDRSEQSRQRVLEHQNSLRSLLGVGDVDSQELEAEIMRQITNGGLLEGVDLGNMNRSQEEELTERIVQAFRERRTARRAETRNESGRRRADSNQRRPESQTRGVEPERRRADSETRGQTGRRRRNTTDREVPQTDAPQVRERHHERPSRPPVSRPQLLEAATNTAHTANSGRRSSSQGSTTRARPAEPDSDISSERLASEVMSRSTSDLPIRARSRERAQDPRLRTVSRERRATNPESRSINDTWQVAGNPNAGRPQSSRNTPSSNNSDRNITQRGTPPTVLPHDLVNTRNETVTATPSMTNGNANPIVEPKQTPTSSSAPYSSPIDHRITASTPRLQCESCHRQHVEQELHYTCYKCSVATESGSYALCLRCYRRGKGCRHWFGFGHAARARYQKLAPAGAYPADYDQPHAMAPERYRFVETPNTRQWDAALANAEPSGQYGKFCDTCFANANSCYWHCESCNDGEWGYCNVCVNQAKHCTHPLSALSITPRKQEKGGRISPRSTHSPSTHQAKSLIVHTQCANCLKHILFTQARFHCPTCNFGNYDLCTPCYNSMVTTNQISLRNGPQGWRRCPQGHRMLVIGFDDAKPDRRRIILEGIVGGWALHEGEDGSSPITPTSSGSSPTQSQPGPTPPAQQERNEGAKTPPSLQRWSWRDPDSGGGWKHKKRGRRPSSSDSQNNENTAAARPTTATLKDIPPSGGSGMKMLALWSRVTEEGVEDELEFPRGAVVEEVVDINGDWCWGVYCRRTGLFPGGWARLIS